MYDKYKSVREGFSDSSYSFHRKDGCVDKLHLQSSIITVMTNGFPKKRKKNKNQPVTNTQTILLRMYVDNLPPDSFNFPNANSDGGIGIYSVRDTVGRLYSSYSVYC